MPRSTVPRSSSCPTSIGWPSSASRRRRSRRRCASPRSATSTPTSPSSRSATARSRSASSSTRARARRSGGGRARLPVPTAVRRQPCRCRRSPRSSFGQGPSSIDRFNRERRVVIGADMAAGAELGEGLGDRLGAAGGQDMPAGIAHPGDRRRRDHGRGVRRLRHRHGRRPDAGAGRADPAVRLGLPARHHPGLAAAGDRRRGRRRSAHQQCRSRCRW